MKYLRSITTLTVTQNSIYTTDIFPGKLPSEVCNELSNHEAKDDQVIALCVLMRDAYLCLLVHLMFPPVHVTGGKGDVKQDQGWISFHQPSAYQHFPSPVSGHLN